MITASDNLKQYLRENHTVQITAGCTFEYNMNAMVNNITVDGATYTSSNQAFKKLFPVDTLVKPVRPQMAGIKYYIFGDLVSGEYVDSKNASYSKNYRIYYPGVDTTYKYFVTPIGEGANLTINYPKTIFTNKIVVKFEISHSVPSSWNISGTLASGGSSYQIGSSSALPNAIKSFTSTNNDAGNLVLYYNGSTWSTNEADLNTSAHVELSKINLTVGGNSGKFVGIIEVAPKYVIDVSNDIADYSISKESSSSSSDILPVGYVSANSLSLEFNRYNQDEIKAISYIKNATQLSSDKIYFYKNAEIKPHFKIYHSNGAYGSTNKYDKVEQGVFLMDSWNISEYGDVSVRALDGAKILQETVSPDILCEGYSITAIIRRLLDTIGFTNYKINTKDPISDDKSITTLAYWWTDDTKTVWDQIQELCRDNQMTAVFDENNILQFYTRDYLYDSSRTSSWTFTKDKDGSNLPDIQTFSKEDLPSANKVKVLWQSALKSSYVQSATNLWKSPISYLGAFGLSANITESQAAGTYMTLEPVITDEYSNVQAAYSFNGYLLIDSEIIEYDAIEYKYVPVSVSGIPSDSNWVTVNLESESDALKYRALSRVESVYFKPTGRYRIKARGVFGTVAKAHTAGTVDEISKWTKYGKEWNT